MLNGTWVLAVPEADAASTALTDCATVLGEHGANVVVLLVDGGRDTVKDVAERLGEAVAEPGTLSGVLSLLSFDERPHPVHGALPVGSFAVLALLRAMTELGLEAPLWCATRTAVSVRRSDVLARPAQAQTWGLGRVASLEHPKLWGGLVDLPERVDATALNRLVSVLARTDHEDQVAVREAGVLTRRVVPAPLDGPEPARPWKPSGTSIITGGTGALGGHVARWLAGNGAEHVVLTSRSGGKAAGVDDLVVDIEKSGARVTVAACDVTDRAAVAALLEKLAADGDVVRTVVHAAGVGVLAPLAVTDDVLFADIASAKVAGPGTWTNSSAGRASTRSSTSRPSRRSGASATTAPTRRPTLTRTPSPSSAGPRACPPCRWRGARGPAAAWSAMTRRSSSTARACASSSRRRA